MPAVRTITRAINNAVSVSIPEEYSQYSLEVIVLPLMDGESDHEVNGLVTPHKREAIFGGLKSKIKHLAPDFDDALDVSRDMDIPSAFDRAGCFDSEDFV